MNIQEVQNSENETFLGISRVFLHDFLKTFVGYFFKLFSVLFVAVNEENGKYSWILRSVINSNSSLFKEFKDLHEC